MKKLINYISVVIALCFTSCEDYLDRPSQSNISERDIYVNFRSFQGFVEEMYNCIVSPSECGAWNNYSFADENLGPRIYNFDTGNYWGGETYFHNNGNQSVNTTGAASRNLRIWEYAWYALAKTNIALEKIEEEGLFEGNADEKKLIRGQALFFRGWFYFEICRYWGGMPYIDKALTETENYENPYFQRTNFKETALKMAADFREAADLLPEHWEDMYGKADGVVQGRNDNNVRINKFHALGYLGKALLFAASPMMNEEATGVNAFDPELCARAADAFGELLALAESTNRYTLASWNDYNGIFFCANRNAAPYRNGLNEVIMLPTTYDGTRFRWSTIGALSPADMGLNAGTSADVPTHNIVRNFATASGLPQTDDPAYDLQKPWTNLEPRFYKVIAKHGDKIHNGSTGRQILECQNGGYHRTWQVPTVTGYYQRKFSGLDANANRASPDCYAASPYLRLADVYLMYAEAVNFMTGGGPKAKTGNYSKTAEEALNMVRERAQIPPIDTRYTSDKDVFFEEIVRERAVELFMEGARFCDLRRWNRNYDPRYLNKTGIYFDLDDNGEPVAIEERVVTKRAVDKKHNWLPIIVKYTTMYSTFPQNPGW